MQIWGYRRGRSNGWQHRATTLPTEPADELTGWLESLAEAEELTPFATTVRYPGETLRVSKEDAIGAVNIAERTLGEVSERLTEEGVKSKVWFIRFLRTSCKRYFCYLQVALSLGVVIMTAETKKAGPFADPALDVG